ncbi:MAG: hypothetical protein APG12_00276 [Candidatus Methanofastidiosum methylothiophilum]|uniref:UPF0179 protein APG10_00310 n=1 Tax=Candidatus Methanofastidiosum methylothiophilum TaxID=1705564 RepID=A0A150IUV6_9EURY|nr:MAG: hypothetical protein APG10_00310 [Candidatus Methanofastidiosum methylthiophilus]KYC48645.1 MAG: hypothetical protein APG11_00155 [Candidatus Methanofastidiosum methylthiophilus]KYC51150.1 MAG: hypothetical protein APG12_00276 [Candidatus Methanofastidiosum methylthiophilus]
MILTLLPKNLAKQGFSFVAGKGDVECKECRFYRTCVENLKPGRVYTVCSVRNIEHPCKIHDSGVKIVEVKEAQIEAAVPKKFAIEGATGIFSFSCKERCQYQDFCVPDGIKDGDKFLIISIKEKLECPLGNNIQRVILKRKD